jgi:Zn-dependent peptidase ImmA (M78 family)
MEIGRRLKIARDAIGYTLDKASQLSKIGKSSLSEFENARREPKFFQLARLAEIYRKPIEFFLSDQPILPEMALWHDPPENEEEKKKTEARFFELCEQYHRLEVLTDEVHRPEPLNPYVSRCEEPNYTEAESLARKVQREFGLGEIPTTSLKPVLEEKYYVKIFYLDFAGSSISTVSERFGPAICLNGRNKQWRRSYDLAHELFHILTWEVFRANEQVISVASKREEKLANAFASRLLMPEKPLAQRIRSKANRQGRITFDQLEEIAREYDVSLAALIYRLANIFELKKEDTQKYREAADKWLKSRPPRESGEPETLPERYRELAIRALRAGKLSLMQFAKYMDITYKKAQEYLTEGEDFTDEKVTIPVA